MIEFLDKDFAALPTLKECRVDAGVSVAKLARLLEVLEATVRNWESGRRQIGLRDALRVAKFFGKTVYEINWWPTEPA